MRNNYLPVLKQSTVLHKTTIASCAVKPCVQNVLIYVVFYFVVYTNHKISRFTVLNNFWVLSSSYTLFPQLARQDANKAKNETEKAREKENERIGSKILDDFHGWACFTRYYCVSIWYTPSVIHASLCLLQFYRKSIFQQSPLQCAWSNSFTSCSSSFSTPDPTALPSSHSSFSSPNPTALPSSNSSFSTSYPTTLLSSSSSFSTLYPTGLSPSSLPPIQQVHLPAVFPSIHLRFTWYNPLAILPSYEKVSKFKTAFQISSHFFPFWILVH